MADRACWNATIDCPSTSHNCFIYCAEYYACKYATINSSSSNGNLTVINIDSSQSDWLLRGTKIYCPNGGSCSVNCAGSVAAYGGCSEMTVYGQHAKRVYIDTGKGGANGLRWTKIYCPHNSNGTECTIVIQNTGYSYQMKGMQIYAIDSLNDVSVTCKPTTTTWCYPVDDPPIMHYTLDYSWSCTMDLIGQDQWNCLNPRTSYPTLEPTTLPSVAPSGVSLHPSAAPSSSPTHAPSTSPTVQTLIPTYDPTSEPTIKPTDYPTFGPTDYPTFDPTIEPTHEPTHNPSMEPTNEPTNDPTKDPTIDPTHDPTSDPSNDPTDDPTLDPTHDPTHHPTLEPTTDPSMDPTMDPTN
eukprot:1028620_1